MSLTWGDFKIEVRTFLHNYNDVGDMQALIDASIRQGAADIQRLIRAYRTGHSDVYNASELVSEGFAHLGPLPDGKIISARLVKYDTTDNVLRPNVFKTLVQVPWDRYPAMRGGELDFSLGVIALNPVSRKFAVCPPLNTETRLLIEWEGIKTDFDDADTTPFDQRMAEVVSDYVLYRVKRTIDKDVALIRSHEVSYVQGKAALNGEANWNALVESRTPSQLEGDEEFSGSENAYTMANPLFEYHPEITNIVDLSDVVTANGRLGTSTIYLIVLSGKPEYWRLTDGNWDTDVEDGYVRPSDYNASSNARVWQRIE